MEIDRKYIQSLIWKYFKNNHDTTISIDNVLSAVKAQIGPNKFNKIVAKLIYEEVFNLSNYGLIVFAQINLEGASMHSGFPWITITEYGKNCFQTNSLLPYDLGYIQKVKEMIPNIDEITLKYIGESINAFNRHAPISATITMGIASEQMMLLLIEAYIFALKKDKERESLLKKIKDRFIETQYTKFRESFNSHKHLIPGDIIRNTDIAIDATFRFIKMLRNEQGHPTAISADNDTVFADLQHFPHYARRMFGLIKWLQENKL